MDVEIKVIKRKGEPINEGDLPNIITRDFPNNETTTTVGCRQSQQCQQKQEENIKQRNKSSNANDDWLGNDQGNIHHNRFLTLKIQILYSFRISRLQKNGQIRSICTVCKMHKYFGNEIFGRQIITA